MAWKTLLFSAFHLFPQNQVVESFPSHLQACTSLYYLNQHHLLLIVICYCQLIAICLRSSNPKSIDLGFISLGSEHDNIYGLCQQLSTCAIFMSISVIPPKPMNSFLRSWNQWMIHEDCNICKEVSWRLQYPLRTEELSHKCQISTFIQFAAFLYWNVAVTDAHDFNSWPHNSWEGDRCPNNLWISNSAANAVQRAALQKFPR